MSENNYQDTVLVLQGSYQDFDKILTLFLSGELEEYLEIPISDVGAVSQYQPTDFRSVAVCISEWFQKSLVAGWEYETILLGSFLTQPINLISENRDGTNIIAQPTLTELINLLNNADQKIRFRAAVELAERQEDSPEAATALVDAIQTSDAATAWQMALILEQIVPGHPQAAIAQRQEVTVADLRLELLVALRRSESSSLESSSLGSSSVDILLQLYSTEDQYLPAELKLTVMNELEEITSERKTDDQTPYLSLQLSGSQGQEFAVQTTWNEHCIKQYFVI